MYTAVQRHQGERGGVGGWGGGRRQQYLSQLQLCFDEFQQSACKSSHMHVCVLGEFIPFHAAGVRLRTSPLYLLVPHLSAELIWARSLRREDTHLLISCLCAGAGQ